MPIVGLEIEQIVNRHIDDLKNYRKLLRWPDASGIMFTWTMIPVPDPRFVDVDVSVFHSHRMALQATARYFMSIAAVPTLIQPSLDDPGYVTWCFLTKNGEVLKSGGLIFVRDNVFVRLHIADQLNPQDMEKAFDNDLKYGAPGVFRGTSVEPPEIIDSGFPSEITFRKGEKGLAGLGINDPKASRIFRNIWVESYNLPPIPPNVDYPRPNPPRVEWKKSGEVKIYHERDKVSVQLAAVAVNDRCVVSDVWRKDVRFIVTDSTEQ